MTERYLSEMSEYETKFILSAFERLKFHLFDSVVLCSHLHERNFLHQHNASIRKRDKIKNISIPLVNSLNRKLTDIASNEPVLETLITEFKKNSRNLYKSEVLLWCASLLVNYHKKEECSEYLSLALKFKMVAYVEFIGYRFYKVPVAYIMKIMLENLRYMSLYKCKHVLFMSYIDEFLESRYYNIENDFLQPVLSQVLNAAHELRFNFFRFWDRKFVLMARKYIQKSILENVKRYLVLVKYGYEDERYSRAFFFYDLFMRITDWDNLFGFQRRVVRRRSNKKYRPYQVLYLYVEAYYNEKNNRKDLYDKVLRVLWKSIPDPFLSKKQFLSSFDQSDKFPEFLEVWKWYAKVVLNDVESEKSPRSLKHLTKCSIRRVLTESVQMPFGIESLDIPQSMKSYLRLENLFTP